jgi:hypothetical protein
MSEPPEEFNLILVNANSRLRAGVAISLSFLIPPFRKIWHPARRVGQSEYLR